MNKEINRKIEKLMQDKGFTSAFKLVEFLNRDYVNIAEGTVYNALKGQNVQLETLEIIAEGLGIPLKCLFSNNGPLVKNYFDYEVAEKYDMIANNRKAKMNLEVNSLELFRTLYDIDQRFYFDDIGNIYENYDYRITSLGEFVVFMPLMDSRTIADLLKRIGGDVVNREFYVLDLLRAAYNRIPDIPAKKYADYRVNKARLCNKTYLTEIEQKYLEELNRYERNEEFDNGYLQYESIVERKLLLNSKEIKNIEKALIPEIY